MSEGAFYDVRDVKAAANNRWVEVLANFGANTSLLRNIHGPCPACGGKDRFRFDDQNGDGSFICSRGGGGILAGDGFALLGHLREWEWKRCVAEVGMMLGVQPRRGEVSQDPAQNWNAGVAMEPRQRAEKEPEIDQYRIWEMTQGMPNIDEAWLMRRSPVDVAKCDPLDFLGYLYRDDEKVLIFTEEFSQGNFIAWRRDGELGDGKLASLPVSTFRLAQQKGVKAVRSALPTGGAKGVWFLVNPVSGEWKINPRARNRANEKEPKWSRRSEEVVTSFRFFVLESDKVDTATWLKVVVNLQVPIIAIYTSGGRSIHVLLMVEMSCKAEWDATRDMLRELVCPLGADPGAMSAVRLSRLPGCMRGDKPQRLLYLNPNPEHLALRLMPERR